MIRLRWTSLLAVGVSLCLARTSEGAPRCFSAQAVLSDFSVAATGTTDMVDAVAAYLAPYSKPLGRSLEHEGSSSSDAPMVPAVVSYRAPRLALMESPADTPQAQTVSLVFPHVSGLADLGADGRAIPLGNTTFMTMGPGGYASVMVGRPTAGMPNWSHASQTAMSYVRPHVNVQMMMALELPGTVPPGSFEGPGVEPHAYLAVDHHTKVDSADLGAASERFGTRPHQPPQDEPQTAVAAGLDLGLLPTFLSQMGVNLSVVASRGRNTGNLRVALVGTTELPVDWTPRERPYQHPRGLAVEPYLTTESPPYYSGFGSASSRPPSDKPPYSPPTPITPVIPEPGTITLLGLAAAAITARRKVGR